jgi:uncharacterized membrane protein
MLPDPLHPAIVHFPVVLAFLLPISAVVAIWTIRRGAKVTRAWLVPLALAAGLALSSWVSVETGESQDEKIERVVQEQPLETHEEAAEAFLTGSIIVLVVTAAGFARGMMGRVGRVAATVGALALIAGATYVGHTGGELVYKYGAASAYADPGTPGPSTQRDVARNDED